MERKDPSVLPEGGVEGYREEPAFVERRVEGDHAIPDVQKRLLKEGAVPVDDRDRPDLVDDEEPARAVAGVREHQRRDETPCHGLEAYVDCLVLTGKPRHGGAVPVFRRVRRTGVRQVPGVRQLLRPGKTRQDEDKDGCHDCGCAHHEPHPVSGSHKGYPARS